MKIRGYAIISALPLFLVACHSDKIPVPEKKVENTEQTDDSKQPEEEPEDKPVNEELLLGLNPTLKIWWSQEEELSTHGKLAMKSDCIRKIRL